MLAQAEAGRHAQRAPSFLFALLAQALVFALDFLLVNRLATMGPNDTAVVFAIAGSSCVFTFLSIVGVFRSTASWLWRGPAAFLVLAYAALKVGLAVDFFFFA